MDKEQKKTNPEHLYYENEDIWSKDFELDENEAERFDTLEKLVSQNSTSIVDVGCGNGDFLKRLEGKYDRICGVERSKVALQRVSAEKYEASIDDLPFKNHEFDSVFCLEVIEHLPLPIYSDGLKELARIARKQVIISVPFDEDTKTNLVTCPSCFCTFNRNYHLRSFDKNKMNSLFKNIDDGLEVKKIAFAGSFEHPVGLDAVKKIAAPFRVPRLPKGAVCPQCSYTDMKSSNSELGPDSASKGNPQKSVIRKMIPKMSRPRWIIASYLRKD